VKEQKQPPCDLAAEQGVLGGILNHGAEVMAAVSSFLECEDFFDRCHATVYLAMDQLFDHGEPIDEITVTSYLRDQGKLKEIGGETFLAELADTVLGPAHVEHYALLVRKKAELRRIAAAAAQARSIALNPGMDPDVALAEAEKLIFSCRATPTSRSLSCRKSSRRSGTNSRSGGEREKTLMPWPWASGPWTISLTEACGRGI